jgi:hypothetical protein
MSLHVSGAARVMSLSVSSGGGGRLGGSVIHNLNLALVASNGARVYDLRMSGRPLRLTSREPGQRWVAAGHTAASEPVTLSASGGALHVESS